MQAVKLRIIKYILRYKTTEKPLSERLNDDKKNNDFRKTSIKVAKPFCLKMILPKIIFSCYKQQFCKIPKNDIKFTRIMFKIEIFQIWSVESYNNFESIRRES